MKVRLITINVDGIETKVALQDEELASRFCFWLIGNDYEFKYKTMPKGFTLPEDGRATWIFSEFMKEDGLYK